MTSTATNRGTGRIGAPGSRETHYREQRACPRHPGGVRADRCRDPRGPAVQGIGRWKGASCSATVALSPTTTRVIWSGLRYVVVIRCTSAGDTAITRFTYPLR